MIGFEVNNEQAGRFKIFKTKSGSAETIVYYGPGPAYIDSGLDSTKEYRYRICAFSESGEEILSAVLGPFRPMCSGGWD